MTIVYQIKEKKSIDVVRAIKTFLREEENMEVRIYELENKEYIVQGRVKNGDVLQLVGMDRMITVRITNIGAGNIAIDVGKGRWRDKGTVFVLSLLVLWPLSVMSGIGMYKQGRLPGRIYKAVEQYLEYGTKSEETFVGKL